MVNKAMFFLDRARTVKKLDISLIKRDRDKRIIGLVKSKS